jgi:hypothetical protein
MFPCKVSAHGRVYKASAAWHVDGNVSLALLCSFGLLELLQSMGALSLTVAIRQ